MRADTYLMDLQNMQKQLMDTIMLMMQNENQKQDRGSKIGTQININNMNVDMTTNKEVKVVEKRMDTPKSICMKTESLYGRIGG